MFIRTTLLAAAAAVGLAATSASATTYKATSFDGNPNHSVWFSTTPSGTSDHRFKFENIAPGFGKFETMGSGIGSKATLTGLVKNSAGAVFELMISMTQVADPGVYKQVAGSSRADWTFYDLDPGSMLKSLTAGVNSFDLVMRGKINGMPLKVQVGTGANDKNPFKLGLSTWFKAKEKGCAIVKINGVKNANGCEILRGDINILLEKDGGGGGVIPLPATALLLPAALGMLGAAGGIARRRRNG